MAFAGLTAAAQIAPRASDRQVRDLLVRIETKTDAFRQSVDRSLDRGRWDNTNREESIMTYITDFENATDELRRDFDSRRSISNEVSNVLDRAWYIDDFVRRNQLNSSVRSQWNSLRYDLNTLARYSAVSWNWNRRNPTFPIGGVDARLTGTYRMNTGLSDNVDTVIDRALGDFGQNDRTRLRRNLERRLSAPQELAIQKNGRTVTIASNLSPQVSFQADGIVRTETTNRGRTIRTTATSTRNGVTINTDGDRANDFWVSFETVGNDRLRVTRRIYLENRNQTVTATSVYDKTDRIARWPAVTGRPGWDNTGSIGDFYIPNGTQLTAVLRNRITSRDSQPGDRFTMEVTSPSTYRGAIIEGRVAQAESSGRVSGRANVALEFDSIRFNGREYRFAGIIDSAREADGDTISINNEGTVRDGNQTTRTVTRAGIGAALGAIIGAIAGGGEGAAIGAGIGAGAGAGSVILQGRDNIELEQGSQFTITATAPTGRAAL